MIEVRHYHGSSVTKDQQMTSKKVMWSKSKRVPHALQFVQTHKHARNQGLLTSLSTPLNSPLI